MALWPAPRGRMDDWSASATAPAAAIGEAPNPTKPVTLTQARFFMDDIGATLAQSGVLTRGREAESPNRADRRVR